MGQKEENNKEGNRAFSLSTIKLYNDSFLIGVPVLILVTVLQYFWNKNIENLVLIGVLLAALFFFRVYRNNKTVITHQICFHQVFVLATVIVAIVWFTNNGGTRELAYLLFIGSGASYLYIEQKTTLSYFIIYHVFLYVLSLYYPSIKLHYVVYSIIFSSVAIFVSRWLHQLIVNSYELQVSEKKFKILFEQGNSAVILLKKNKNNKFEIIETNEKSETVFGITKNDLIEQRFDSFFGEDEEKKEELCQKIKDLRNQEKFIFTGSFRRKNDELFIAETTFVSVDLNNENVIQVFVNDITEKRLSETKISESVQSFRNIVDNSPISIFIFTKNQLVYKNSKAELIFNQFLDKSKTDLFEIFPKDQQFLLNELIGENLGESGAYTEIVLGSNEEEKKFSISLVNVIYDGTSSMLLMLMDISLQNENNIQKIRAEIAEEANKRLSDEINKHKETQHDLLEKTSKLNALFESSSNLFILTIDRDLNISSFNTSFKNMMRHYLDAEVKVGNDFLNTFPIEQAAYGKLIKRFKRALRGESVEIISHFPTKKGEIWIESFICPVRVEGEEIKEIAFIAHNITEKVENERKVLDSEANNRATVSAIPDMLFKVNKEGYFTYYRLNDDGGAVLKEFTFTTDLLGMHILTAFKNVRQGNIFLQNIQKALRTGQVHTQNFIIPFIIGRTTKRMVFENRYSRVNSDEVIVITRDVTDKVEFETQLIESVKEKEILLKEVHHRVKNNLQVISSILNLQSSYVEDEKTLEIINESQNRIRSMSYIHESLYQTKDFSSIDFHDYITNLVQNLVHSYQLFTGKTKLNLDIEKVQLILDQAIPCGLILNELVSNSLKYAYPEETGGEIEIEIKEKDGKINIRVEDFGVGLPEGFKIEDSDSLGLGLVDTLVDQIDGELILKTGGGTKYLIIFEKQDL
ncbi:MAG: PAS domain S-box-containing protein [Crocinitomix sp.]|jgi:PAS domain S-box-containing protein